jgi:hypothetical protein
LVEEAVEFQFVHRQLGFQQIRDKKRKLTP